MMMIMMVIAMVIVTIILTVKIIILNELVLLDNLIHVFN